MIFASPVFLFLFLPLNLILYFIFPSLRVKRAILLIFSLVFYAWGRPAWMLLLVATAFSDFTLARIIDRHRGTGRAKVAFAASLIIDIGIFVAFKYSGFLAENVNALFGSFLPVPEWELPIGISFYTFQTLTYVIDVYRGNVKAQTSFVKYLLYLSMYFQLIAGPIVRYADVASDIEKPAVSFTNVREGIERFLIGLAKKVILADTAALTVRRFMDADPASLSTLAAWLGIVMYTVELYFDFSGYSDMAIGLGRIFGFRFPENFNYPYISQSVSEFWRRWHISLGSFFRDYVYIPLGGNRKRVYLNLFVVWFLTGFWHGASWNFVIWGLYNGLFIALERLCKPFFEKLPAFIRHVYLLIVVNVGFVFFYFTDIGGAFAYLARMFGGADALVSADFTVAFMNELFFILLAFLFCTPVLPLIQKRLAVLSERSAAASTVVTVTRGVLLAGILFVCTAFLAAGSYSPFLYFQF